ncbi:aminotransferase class III-fold pyridoxal phosphate-dependent enzyme [Fusibacter ferrireducens]|uniref:Aminotransferase class III-fold pyridoxal phosphate-dependent enzyme n=1 Tax=Fusibacter ferrireducens TaxID=2785058 RepID=A0ABR9ZQU7_9FIRM|nr:aminotransferase class III-fold pyridoxal phosphate-dependent enzyme [Fusibacter ferrireducens]MBF4692691.1 aminotransferase class III-fold pyridoxal phosphate-dependent enzyme [Fusibacter ferrireducens]
MAVFYPHPILDIHLISAKGNTFTDDKNRTYLDFESGIWCANIGHNPESIAKVYASQSQKIIHHHTYFKNNATENLSDQLLAISNFDNGAALFLSSGSEAVLCAITIAKTLLKKAKCVSLEHSYLGAYPTMISNTSEHIQVPFLKCDPNCDGHESWHCEHCAHVPNVLKELHEPFIFILELGTQEHKIIFPARKLIQYIYQKITEYNGLLVCNEITSGIGRTSEWFAFNHYDLKPHLIALGKGLGNGFPISAILMDQRIYSAPDLLNFKYAQSHQNDPLGAEVARSVIDFIIQNDWIAKSKEISHYFINRLTQLIDQYDSFIELRGKGLMLGLVCDKPETAIALQRKLLEHNIFVGCFAMHAIIRFFPPMTITEDEIDTLIDTISLFFTDKK